MSAGAMPRRRRVFVWSAVFGYSGLAFTLARNVLMVPLYLHYIDLGEYGAWLATGGALVQLLVADFGLSGVVTQRVAAQAGGQDSLAMRSLAAAGLLNALLLALLLGAASSLMALWLPATQGLEAAQRARVLDCYLIAVAANSIGIVAMSSLAALRGAQRPAAAGGVMLVADAISVIVTVSGLFAGLGLYSIALGLLTRSACNAIGGLGIWAWSWRGAERFARPPWRDSIAMWRDSARFFATSIAMRLQNQANVLFVGVMLGPHAAAIYGLTVRAHETVHLVMGQFNTALGPVYAHLAGAGRLDRLLEVLRGLLPMMAALAAVGAAGVVVLNESFVTLWAGHEVFGGARLTLFMGLALWVTCVAFVGYEVLLARGEFAFIARIFAVGSAVHVVSLLLLLKFIGLWAAPLALVASSLCWGTLAWRRLAADMRVIGLDARAPLIETATIGATAVLSAAVLMAVLPAAGSWLALAGEALLAAAFVVAMLLVLRPGLRRLLREEILSTLRALRAA